MTPTALKPLRHPRRWLGLWWLAIVITIAVCLVPGPDLPQTPPGSDKIEHFLAYFILAAAAVQLYATRRALWTAALGLIVLGIAIEIAQGTLTTTRAADAWDAFADALGVAAGMATAWTPLRNLLLRIDR